MKLQLSLAVADKRLRDILCNAFEGGSNYWYFIEDTVCPPGTTLEDFFEGGSRQDPENYFHYAELLPLEEGGALIIRTLENDEINGHKSRRLDRDTIAKGCAVMAEKYARHWSNFVTEHDDAETGDVFLQCCLFGEIVFG